MAVIIRRSKPEDAQGIRSVAEALSKAVMEQNGADEELLSDQGFLLYPLAADNSGEPNYAERTSSEHFWIAEHNQKIIAFMMAYTFEKMCQFAQLTPNDNALINYFTDGQMHALPESIYVAQVGTHPDFKRKGVLSSIMNEAFKAENRGHSPAAIAEIAQSPLRNIASSVLFMKNGFAPTNTRTKDTDKPQDQWRTSGTFTRTFDEFTLDKLEKLIP